MVKKSSLLISFYILLRDSASAVWDVAFQVYKELLRLVKETV